MLETVLRWLDFGSEEPLDIFRFILRRWECFLFGELVKKYDSYLEAPLIRLACSTNAFYIDFRDTFTSPVPSRFGKIIFPFLVGDPFSLILLRALYDDCE